MDNFDERVQAYLKGWEEFKDLALTHRKLDDLQQRIDKAVEYIKEWQSFPHTNCTTHKELKNLLNILKGDDTND